LRYEGEAHVGGMIAAVGQRMIDVAARRIIQQFFDSASAQLRT
jgi:carbon monoxide dehydrogenase subunit G